MKNSNRYSICLAAMLCVASVQGSAQIILRASHQWPGGTGDVRDEMVQTIAREVERADVDLIVRVYPGQSLFKAGDQWSALVRGRLDITALPWITRVAVIRSSARRSCRAWSRITITPQG